MTRVRWGSWVHRSFAQRDRGGGRHRISGSRGVGWLQSALSLLPFQPRGTSGTREASRRQEKGQRHKGPQGYGDYSGGIHHETPELTRLNRLRVSNGTVLIMHGMAF